MIRNNIVYDTASDGIAITTNPEHLMPGPRPRLAATALTHALQAPPRATL